MCSVRVSSQLLVSLLSIAVSTNTKNSKIFPILVSVLFLAKQLYNYMCTIDNMLFLFCNDKIIAW